LRPLQLLHVSRREAKALVLNLKYEDLGHGDTEIASHPRDGLRPRHR
jgi:hypothetical protein